MNVIQKICCVLLAVVFVVAIIDTAQINEIEEISEPKIEGYQYYISIDGGDSWLYYTNLSFISELGVNLEDMIFTVNDNILHGLAIQG